MTENLITHLRHVDIAMPDLAGQLAFYRDLWGLTEVANDSGVHFLAAEGSPEQYVMRLRRDDSKRVDLLAFGAASPADVDKLTAHLISSDVKLIHEPRTLTTPGGGYGVRFFDHDGRVVEVSADVATRAHRIIEAGESIPVRLSHCVLNTPDPESTVRWYNQKLGFQLSETLQIHGNEIMWFMRCSSQHHTLAVARAPHMSLHHASFDMRGLDEFMYGAGRMMQHGTPLVWGPGRHGTGHNTFSYFRDVAGNVVEYSHGMITLDEDTWHPEVKDLTEPGVMDLWGTANSFDEAVGACMNNDPDRGSFIAPPV